MDYEQKYKEALEKAREYFKANQKIGEVDENDVLSGIFPELSESDRWQEPCKLNPEKGLSNPIDHWQDLRERAAIAILQAMVTDKDFQRYSGQYKSEMAVKQADALVEKLKGE